MAGTLPQYLATPSTYGVKKPALAPAPASFARPQTAALQVTPGGTASKYGAPTTGVAGGVSKTFGGTGVTPMTGAAMYGRPAAPAAAPAAAPSTGLTTKPYVNPFADDGSSAKKQAEINKQMDARSAAQQAASMQQQEFDLMKQGGGGGYDPGGGYNPMPIPIAPGEDPQAPGGTTIVTGGGSSPQAPDVGTGWADFAARPTGPQGLGMSRQQTPMQALKAMRAGGGLY